METSNDCPGPWPSFLGHETVDEGPAPWVHGNANDNYYNAIDWSVGNSVPDPATPQIQLTQPNLEDLFTGFLQEPIDYSPAMTVPNFSFMMDTTSPSSSGGASSASAFAEFGSISSPATSEPALDPFSPMGQSPLPWREPLQSPVTNPMPEPFAAQPNTNACIGKSATFETPIIRPVVSLQQPSSQMTNAPRQLPMEDQELTMKDRPPGMPARKWRKIIKPEKCPECPMCFDYLGERDKHIAAAHADVADKHGVLVETYVCSSCGSVYTRKDRLTRHMTNKHGRMPKKKRHRK